jgi:serine protease AprX
MGSMTASNGVTAITTAVSSGVQVASCSWGFTHAGGAWTDPPTTDAPDDSCVLCTAVNNAVAAGVVFCIAAGNEDNDSCSTYDTHIGCPGNARSAITVGASDDSDHMAGFSSVGPTPQGRQKPDLVAPGVQIASCRASGTSLGSPIDANFTNLDGTSMATPHVAGVAALMLNKTATLSPANVMSIMTTTAVNIGASAVEMGAGRVDALAAVNAS